MAFKQIHAKHRDFPSGYWERRRSDLYAKESHGKFKLGKLARTGTENAVGMTRITHTEGRWVKYKGDKPAMVLRVEPKGVWLREFEVKGDKGIIDDETTSKVFFVPEKDYEKNVEPYTIPSPFSTFGLMGIGYIEL